MVSNMMSVSASVNLILQVPLQAPVMQRELSNKMYTPTTYFIGSFLSNLIMQLIHPIIMVCMLFWTCSINESYNNFIWFIAFAQISNLVFCGQGYFCGTMVTDGDSAKLVNLVFLMTWITGNGVLANLDHPNWIVNLLCHISPGRYNCEGFLRRMVQQVPDLTTGDDPHYPIPLPISPDIVLQQYNYTWGDNYCLNALLIWFGVWVVLSLIGINLKYRNL